MYDDEFSEHQSVTQRAAKAKQQADELIKQGYTLNPIKPFRTQKIAQSFWGHAWCRHLETISDHQNRLPSGRSYIKNGSVLHLEIKPGKAIATIGGDEIRELTIDFDFLPIETWDVLKKQCSGKIGSLIELLQGNLSDEVMGLVSAPETGLFPLVSEIHTHCNCPDHADICTHIAAALYGIGRRLDEHPESLFELRGVDQIQLIDTNFNTPSSSSEKRIATDDLSAMFGIELDTAPLEERATIPDPVAISQKKENVAPKKSSKKKAVEAPKIKPAPQTGNDIKKLRHLFGMTEYEFGLIIDTSSTTIAEWESVKKQAHNVSPEQQAQLTELAQLPPEQAQQRLNEYR